MVDSYSFTPGRFGQVSSNFELALTGAPAIVLAHRICIGKVLLENAGNGREVII